MYELVYKVRITFAELIEMYPDEQVKLKSVLSQPIAVCPEL